MDQDQRVTATPNRHQLQMTNSNISNLCQDRLRFGLTTLETRRLRGDLTALFKFFKGLNVVKYRLIYSVQQDSEVLNTNSAENMRLD